MAEWEAVASPARRRARLTPAERDLLLQEVERGYGLHLMSHQGDALDEAVAAVIEAFGLHSPLELCGRLAAQQDRRLADELVSRLTVGETHFFRVAPQIDALRTMVMPQLIAQRRERRRLRCWSAGCSTGEEPYTLAILLRQLLPEDSGWNISILATDVNTRALERARQATYSEWSFRETPDWVRRSYFDLVESAGGRATRSVYRLKPGIRNMVRFAALNLADDTYPSRATDTDEMDLVLCRNVAIYLTPEVNARIFDRFARALNPGGWLVTGPSDPFIATQVMEVVNVQGAWLYRLPDPASRQSGPRQTERTGANGVDGSVALRSEASPTCPSARPPVSRPARPPVSRPARPLRPLARSVRSPAPSARPCARLAHAQELASRGQLEQATAEVRGVLEQEPLNVEAHMVAGSIAQELARWDEAIEHFRKAGYLDPHCILAHFNLASLYRATGQPARARKSLELARDLLADLPDGDTVPGTDCMPVGTLRQAVLAQFEA